MFTEALLAFDLYLQEMKARVEHPKELTFETRQLIATPTVRLGETTSITWNIRFKTGQVNRKHRMGGVQ